tara:strand:- start:32 stop:211 length:180 start_codon:yes stop_codon:yes gene_type:complete
MNIEIDISEDDLNNLMDFMDHRAGRTFNIVDRQGSAVYNILQKIVEASTINIMQGDNNE